MAVWSSLAALGSAVVAPGLVSVETHRKAVQHLEGGIVGRIHVKDGSRVARGDLLVELKNVASKSNVERLKSQFYEALAGAARLTAERDGLQEIVFPDSLVAIAADEPVARSAMAAQVRIFDSRRDLTGQKLSVLDKRIDRLQEERNGLRRQIEAVEAQFALNTNEMTDATQLFEKQLIRKSRLTDVQRSRAQLEERRSALQSSLAQTDQQMTEMELRKSELLSSTLTSVVEEIRARQARAHELSRELVAAQDMLQRTRIEAPIEGTVVGLQIHSRDGVIAPGQTLMEIVPLSDDLVVDARVRPEDIEDVQTGLEARVVLNTLSRKFSQPLSGKITQVSADRLIDKLTGRPHYHVRVSLDPASLQPGETKLLAGMSADVFIRTSDRTPFAYLTAPLVRTFHRGMRER
jgi:HlyD family type I secretion membrane fusion protein